MCRKALAAGRVKLVGTDVKSIVANISRLLTDNQAYNAMAKAVNPYGDGKATGRILTAYAPFLNGHRNGI